MKKYTAIVLTLALVLSMTACASAPSPENDKLPANSQTTPSAESTVPPASDVSIEEQVVFDKDGIRVTVKGFAKDNFFGPGIQVLVENSSSQNITVQTRNCSVNGLMLEPMFSCDVAAGKKANDTILFMASQLETAQISTIANVEFYLHIFNSDTWEEITNSDIITLNTSASDYVQVYNDNGFTAFDNGNIKIVIQKLNSEDSFWGSDVYVYAENNTGANITIQARDVSIDGFMVNPVFSCNIAAGKKAYDTITFLQSELENNSITDIRELELKFTIFDSDNWGNIADTDAITVTFE